jgi:hypothetical protein
MWLSHWVLTAAMISQVGAAGPALAPPTAPPMPELTPTQHSYFAIPFRIERSSDPSWQPVEAQLYVSADRGAHWRLYAKAPTTQKQFTFRAKSDGEYWFAVRTADRSGRIRPETIVVPGLRVMVDTKQPAKKLAAKPNQPGRPATKDSKGSVAIAINPAIGRNFAAPNDPSGSASGPILPPGERPRMINSRVFELEYDVDSVGPSGVGKVELWGTTDGGRSWRRFLVNNDGRSPLSVNVDEEGTYGFRMVVTNGAGLGGKPPAAGDPPDLVIGVDLTKPAARIVSARQGADSEAGQLIIAWQADDKMLAARPVSLLYSPNASGPWTTIASGLENSGRYAWPIDNRTPPQLFLRLEVRDEAGNIGVHELAEPVVIDQSRPTVRIRDVRPVGSR